jgi:putative acetyltransferase
MTDIKLALERPDQTDVIRLIAASHAYSASLYPAESNHGLGIEALLEPEVSFLVARRDSLAVGCGALVADADGEAELKSMWVDPACRGQRIGQLLLERLERLAVERCAHTLRLETGVSQPEALGLYRKAGFVETGPFGSYRPDPLSVFMMKRLA